MINEASSTLQEPQSDGGSSSRRPNVLLAITGSVAAIKGPELAVTLASHPINANVRVLLTQGGYNFWSKAKAYNKTYWEKMIELSEKSDEIKTSDEQHPKISICYAEDEWKEWNQLGDPVLHIDLRDWADVMLIAPLSAHTLAKLAHGLCDDTLSCVVRAWDFGHGLRPGKPLLLAPAMNTAMWDHPLTGQQLRTIQGFWNLTRNQTNGVSVIEPMSKELACGEVGNGALANVQDIVRHVTSTLPGRSVEKWAKRRVALQ